jgi:predicted membrane-bound spermidine synthase
MKPKWWQKLWSYVTEVHLESSSSMHNELLEVNLVKGRYQLCTAEAIYSYADKYDNFKLSFDQMKPEYMDFESVLLLGFGLGSVPYMLEKNFKKDCSYTGVEIDDEVIYLASKYVLPDLKSEINLVQADALTFTMLDSSKYDLVIMDVFQSDVIPEVFEEAEFLDQIKELLTADGIFMYNRLGYTEDDVKYTLDFFENQFKTAFPEAYLLQVKGNYMLCNKNVFSDKR